MVIDSKISVKYKALTVWCVIFVYAYVFVTNQTMFVLCVCIVDKETQQKQKQNQKTRHQLHNSNTTLVNDAPKNICTTTIEYGRSTS